MCSIINVMRYWVMTRYLTIDTNILSHMHEFALSIQGSDMMERLALTSIQSSERMKISANELCLAIAERVWFWCFHLYLYSLTNH